MSSARKTGSIVIAALLAACGDDTVLRLQPRLEVDPPMVDFGDGCLNEDNLFELTVKNTGEGELTIESAVLEQTGSAFSIASFPKVIERRSELPLPITFRPTVPRQSYSAKLIITSNDARSPHEVPIAGVGGAREIEVFPTSIDFGLVNGGTAPRRTIEIRNLGGEVLDIARITWSSTSADMRPAQGFFSGGPLACRTSTSVEIIYAPTDLGADQGTLTIESNDEDEPSIVVTVIGRANLAPVAILWGCDDLVGQAGCDGVDKGRRFTLIAGQRVGLEGRESYDPEGAPIMGYLWEIADKPQGSRVTRPYHSTEDRQLRSSATGDLEVDVAGRYDVRLIVKDSRGLESLDLPESHVLIAPKDLEVLLRWDIGTDVDLHLVRPAGSVGDYGSGGTGTSTGSDCSTFNRAPNWNDLMTASDDPRLDLDVVSGRGPEIVSLNVPQGAGEYKVFAHYCDSQDRRIPVNATVEIYVQGNLVSTIPDRGRSFSLAPGELWEAARLTWTPGDPPRASVVALDSGSPVHMPDLCMLR